MAELPELEPKVSVTTEQPENEADIEDMAFLHQMRKRLDRSVTNEKEERIAATNDINFINGEQWATNVIEQRGKGRLCLVINKMPAFLDQIDGDIRQNKPGIKIKAVDNYADPITAEVIEGTIRYIERNSNAGKIYSYGVLHAAAGGRGAWRVITNYVSDDGFEQEIGIQRIINAYSVYYDPAAMQDDKQDGQYMFIITDIAKDEFRSTYNLEPLDFDVDGSEFANWMNDEMVRVGEYFWKEKIGEKTIHQLGDGSVVDSENLQAVEQSVQSRAVPVYQVHWAKVDGKRILERGIIPGRMFPIVLCWGKQLCVNGKMQVRGIARHSKDAQRMYNYFRSNDAEAAALQPKQPYLMPDVCLGPHKEVWDKANEENYPYLPYVADPTQPQMKPTREAPAMASSANAQQVQISDSEIKDTVGIQKAALGQEGNEKSGAAIRQRKMESDTGQFAFLDNGADAVRTTGRIIVSMIPDVLDSERVIRILGTDMKDKLVHINDGGGIDMTTGRYDVAVSADGSYSTQREEFQDRLVNILPHIPPEQVGVFTDILFEMQDFARADDVAERIRKTIPPEILGEEDTVQVPGNTSDINSPDGSLAPGVPPEPEPPSPEEQAAQMEIDEKKLELEIEKVKLSQEQEKLRGMQIDNNLKGSTKVEEVKGVIANMG